jgi:hypothetical protein
VPEPSSPSRKPMTPVRKVSLFRREVREFISPPALEILIGAAEVVAEGSFDPSGAEGPVFLGSVYVRVPLGRYVGLIRGPLDAAAARRLVQLLRNDDVVREVLGELAQRETERVAGCPLFDLEVEIAATHHGDEVHVHLDVEGQVRPRREARRTGNDRLPSAG